MTESQQHPSTMNTASSGEGAVIANYKRKTSEMLSEAYQALFLMSAASAMLLLVRIAVASPWAALLPLYSAGFVLWPLLPAFRAEAMWLAAPIIADMVTLVVMPRITPSKRRQLNEVFIVALTAVALVILAGAVYCTYWPVTSSDNMRELSAQHEAVARFNRGFCEAWCRHKDTSMAAFARGQCPLDEATVFDYLVSHFDVKDWCTEALKTQDYSLGSKYNGFSPFASWMGGGVDDGAQVSTPRWLIILHTLLCLGFHSEVFVNVDNITLEDGDKSD